VCVKVCTEVQGGVVCRGAVGVSGVMNHAKWVVGAVRVVGGHEEGPWNCSGVGGVSYNRGACLVHPKITSRSA